MDEAALAREWTAFGGASLALMGASLAAGARAFAKDHVDWQRQWSQAVGAPPPEAEAGRLAGAYRLGGSLIALVGLAAVGAAARGRTLSAGPGNARLAGGCLLAAGLAAAVQKFRRETRRAPLFLEADPLAAPPEPGWGELASDAAAWLLCALWAAFGLRLFMGANR